MADNETPNEVNDVMSDKHEISRIVCEGFTEYASGGSIVPYHENGEMAHVVWFAVRDNEGSILKRINGKFVVEVKY